MLEIFAYFGNVILLINCIAFFKFYYKQSKPFKIFTFYLLVMLLIQIIVSVLQAIKVPNLFLSHIYFIFQFILLSFFYHEILINPFQQKVIKVSVPFCLIIIAIQYYYNIDLLFKFNLFEIFITSFLLIIFSMFHFYNILNENKKFYYINIGILLYLFGSTVLFISGNLINTLKLSSSAIVWILNSFLYIIYQCYIFVEWWKLFYDKLNNYGK